MGQDHSADRYRAQAFYVGPKVAVVYRRTSKARYGTGVSFAFPPARGCSGSS